MVLRKASAVCLLRVRLLRGLGFPVSRLSKQCNLTGYATLGERLAVRDILRWWFAVGWRRLRRFRLSVRWRRRFLLPGRLIRLRDNRSWLRRLGRRLVLIAQGFQIIFNLFSHFKVGLIYDVIS